LDYNLLLDALMREDREQVEHWKAKLEGLFVEQDGQRLLPELYCIRCWVKMRNLR